MKLDNTFLDKDYERFLSNCNKIQQSKWDQTLGNLLIENLYVSS